MKNDVVTAVEPAGRHRMHVVINGEIRLVLSREVWAERPLKEGEELDFSEFSQWLLPRQYPEALNKAVTLLAQRAHASGEIRQKLQRACYLEDTVDMVLYKLQKERLLNDEAFAREFARSCALRRMGRNRIRQELARKGLSRALIDQALEELPQEEAEDAAVQLAQKLLRKHGSEESFKQMQKVLAAMARRGYSYEDSKQAIETALQLDEE